MPCLGGRLPPRSAVLWEWSGAERKGPLLLPTYLLNTNYQLLAADYQLLTPDYLVGGAVEAERECVAAAPLCVEVIVVCK